MSLNIPVSVIITTKNEEPRIAVCLAALSDFDDVWVVDSYSDDATQAIAEAEGARVIFYIWNGAYPKKRQWCLDMLDLKYNAVFFVDADEIVPQALVAEIAALKWDGHAGFFVQGAYVCEGRILKHGLRNNKLALFDHRAIEFPVVDDIGLEGMGEIEGHYQPVLKEGYHDAKIGQLSTPLVHHAYDERWEERHLRYAAWEAGMNARGAWPRDPRALRQFIKVMFRRLPFRGCAAFVHCYIYKGGFLDGAVGLRFAFSRARYYRMISNANRAQGKSDVS